MYRDARGGWPVRVREPDWAYTSHGPYLVTRRWSDDRSETCAADSLFEALHRALRWRVLERDPEVVVVDGWGEFVFGCAARDAPPFVPGHVGTAECYRLLMDGMSYSGNAELAATALFAGVGPW